MKVLWAMLFPCVFLVATVITGVYAAKFNSFNLGVLCFGLFCITSLFSFMMSIPLTKYFNRLSEEKTKPSEK
jgi:hypothetical protein